MKIEKVNTEYRFKLEKEVFEKIIANEHEICAKLEILPGIYNVDLNPFFGSNIYITILADHDKYDFRRKMVKTILELVK